MVGRYLAVLLLEGGSATGIQSALLRDGHRVLVAPNPVTARALAGGEKIDVALIEVSVGDELDLIQDLRYRLVPPSCVIVALAKDGRFSELFDRESSLDMSLRLPVDTELLTGLLHYLLDLRRAFTHGRQGPRQVW